MADKLDVPRGYQDMASMRKSIIASSGGNGNLYLAGPHGSKFELVPPPPLVPLLPPSIVAKGDRVISTNTGLAKGGKAGTSRLLQPPPPAAKDHAYYGGRRASGFVAYI